MLTRNPIYRTSNSSNKHVYCRRTPKTRWNHLLSSRSRFAFAFPVLKFLDSQLFGGKTSHPNGEAFLLQISVHVSVLCDLFFRLRVTMLEILKWLLLDPRRFQFFTLSTLRFLPDKSQMGRIILVSLPRKNGKVFSEKRRIKFLLMQAKFVFNAVASAVWLGDIWFMSLFNRNRLLLVSYTRNHLEQTISGVFSVVSLRCLFKSTFYGRISLTVQVKGTGDLCVPSVDLHQSNNNFWSRTNRGDGTVFTHLHTDRKKKENIHHTFLYVAFVPEPE